MSRARSFGLVAAVALVLVLIGSLVAGLGPVSEPAAAPRARRPIPPPPPEERVRVEVLNAAGISGLARAVTDDLRAAGFDVVFYGNASTFDRDTSVVLDRVGEIEHARAVARTLRIDRVRSVPDTTLYLDVTVVLGGDFHHQRSRVSDARQR